MRHARTLIAAAAAVALLSSCAIFTPTSGGSPSFFITSAGSGKGADLGGLAGADAICQRLATAAGTGGKTWRAYLSTPPTLPSANNPGVAAVHARDRIGNGPWYNAKGMLIARDLDHLHNGNNISKETALDERGNVVKGRGDTPNEHDMLTGTRSDGTAFAPQTDTTCKSWTSSTDGSAIVGHHDRIGPNADAWAKAWSFSHQSAGCSQEALVRTGGAGRFYCFASN
ncbi:hypothetical protein FN976_22650 [Caenimonas sedimenti]|uniref:Lectin n=1 Tax=Caenimonas sedimenti TaxID=2596921 RepID=A0A562ZJD8_9BURK|nr:hypothetical protein [Caenimonas sedimenti]TWO68435.1 hypothetical protein FN976_22650 [Caenimonas sedimenti]